MKIARIAAGLIVASLLALCFFGRRLQQKLPALIEIIPHFGVLIFFCILLLTLRMTKGSRPSPKQATTIGAYLLLLLGGGTILIEQMIVAPIERIHFIKYCALTVALYYSQNKRLPHTRLAIAGTAAAVFGVVEESLQYFVPDRIFDLRDIALNACGALAGVFFAWITTLWPNSGD